MSLNKIDDGEEGGEEGGEVIDDVEVIVNPSDVSQKLNTEQNYICTVQIKNSGGFILCDEFKVALVCAAHPGQFEIIGDYQNDNYTYAFEVYFNSKNAVNHNITINVTYKGQVYSKIITFKAVSNSD